MRQVLADDAIVVVREGEMKSRNLKKRLSKIDDAIRKLELRVNDGGRWWSHTSLYRGCQ